MALGIGTAIAGMAGPMLGQAFGKMNDDRQYEQQERLTALGIKAGKEMADYNMNQQFDMWNRTNAKAQVEHLKKAGLNPALLYGGGGGGGATTGSASGSVASTGSASGSAERTNATVGATGMGLQLQSQLALQKAQKENIEADTANKQAGAEKTGVETEIGKTESEIKTATKDSTIQQAIENANKTMSEASIKANEGTISDMTMKEQLRSVQEGVLKQILENEGQTTENRKKQAEATIKQFEAENAKQGIATNAPWYVKMVADMLGRLGLNPLK